MLAPFQPTDPARFASALRRFDEENSRDPNTINVNGRSEPKELVYANQLSEWVLRLRPDASEPLRLAARCQHLCRWEIPRNSHPMTRPGYLQWRAELKEFHARRSGDILRQCGYEEATIERVQALNRKMGFPDDAEVRVLEDALCLVFLESQFAELAGKTDNEKMIKVLQKTWKKMTPAAHEKALKLNYGVNEQALLDQAFK